MKKSSSTFPIRFFSVLCTLFLSIINLHCFLISSSRTTKKAMRKGHTRQFLQATRHVGILGLERFRGITSQREIFVTLFWASDNSRKKNSNFMDFQGQIRGKIGQFCGNFAGVFGANFTKRQSVKNGQFCGSFQGKFCQKSIGFALIRPVFFNVFLTEIIICSFNNNTLQN